MSKPPNILILMVDQLNGTLFPDGPADWLHAPNIKALAARSTRFANSYTRGTLQTLRAKSEARWDLDRFDAEVRQSQARRWVVYEALRNGAYYPWDYQPLQRASERYMRNHMNLDSLESEKRFPRGE